MSNKLPMSIDVEFFIQCRDDSGRWKSIGRKVNTRKVVQGILSDHDVSGARKEILSIAQDVFVQNKKDTRIIREYWDSAGWGDGSSCVVWKNGSWVD